MYRVDRRDFKVNDKITPPENSYQNDVNFNASVENIISEQKPKELIADRKNNLFIFTELSDAIRFSCRMTNSKIYKVKQTPDTIRHHRGDMNWTEIIAKLNGNDIAQRQIADFYWNECKTFKPCWEVLVNEMQVVSLIIATEKDRKAMCNKLYSDNCGQNIENLPFYIQNLSNK